MSKIEIHEAESFSDMYRKLDHEQYWRGYKFLTSIKAVKDFMALSRPRDRQVWKLKYFDHRQRYVVAW